MGKFVITEEERKHIMGLYEQGQPVDINYIISPLLKDVETISGLEKLEKSFLITSGSPTQNKKFYGYKPIEYSVAKSGLIGFTKALASYYKGTNIKILSLAFGGFENNTKKLFNKLLILFLL